MNTSKLISPL